MRKLDLKNLKSNANDLLQREQLKTVVGGYGGGCHVLCNSGSQYPVSNCEEAADIACNITGWKICTC